MTHAEAIYSVWKGKLLLSKVASESSVTVGERGPLVRDEPALLRFGRKCCGLCAHVGLHCSARALVIAFVTHPPGTRVARFKKSRLPPPAASRAAFPGGLGCFQL